LEERLYMRGRRVRFFPGAVDSGKVLEGVLTGIGPAGELRIRPDGAAADLSFVTGELDLYSGEDGPLAPGPSLG
jgi:BirA family biotin operon repressor/biotin-[acetyl-CoA-carboxylase] ligase